MRAVDETGARRIDTADRRTADAASHDGAAERPATNATVLIVDDERDIRFLLRFVLEKNGYRVLEAVHGASALDMIRLERPTLLITDLMMPVMDGGELIEALRDANETRHIPAILVSACPERAPREGFDRIMRKPFRPADLIAAVQELLEGNRS